MIGIVLSCWETYVDESHLFRDLLKCKGCGQLYFFEFYEEIDWEEGNDPQYSTYIPVETGAEIEMLKKASPLKLLEHLPQLRHDFPKDAKSPKTYWAKNSQWPGSRRKMGCQRMTSACLATRPSPLIMRALHNVSRDSPQ
jgi:hypothetical protein